jgi:hypothetical protein
MDVTALARTLLEPVPAHRTAGIEVLRAADGAAEVALQTPEALVNVIGSLHSSGLIALVDAAGLAAIIAASGSPEDGWWPPAVSTPTPAAPCGRCCPAVRTGRGSPQSRT